MNEQEYRDFKHLLNQTRILHGLIVNRETDDVTIDIEKQTEQVLCLTEQYFEVYQ